MLRAWTVHILSTTLAVSLGGNVWLLRRLHQTNERQGPAALEAGARVAPFAATDLATGTAGTVRYDAVAQPTVLYVFSPTCVWCERNVDNVRALVGQRGRSYRFLGLQVAGHGKGDGAHAPALPFPTYGNLSAETIQRYGLGATPQTIVVSPEGRVLQSWRGAYGGPTLKEVERYFEASLPGLPAPAGS